MHRLQGSLRLLDGDELPTIRTGVALASLAWLPLAILTLHDDRTWTLAYGTSFLADIEAYTRFVLGMMVLVATDRSTDRRVNRMLASFVRSDIVTGQPRIRFDEILNVADRRTSSALAESLMVIVAYVLAFLSLQHDLSLGGEAWQALPEQPTVLTAAGWWYLLVSAPLFLFMVMRWLWRFCVWALLLIAISRLDLALIPSHPDRSGGLGFLTLFPTIFVPLVFASSAVLASSALQEVFFGTATFETLRRVALMWIMIQLLVFVGPLAAFTPKLLQMRERALVEQGELVAHHNRLAQQRLQADLDESRQLDVDSISGIADIAPLIETAYNIRLLPVTLWAVVPIIVVSMLPMLVVASTLVPIGELLQRIAGFIT